MEIFWFFIGAGIVACAYVAGRIAGRRAVRKDKEGEGLLRRIEDDETESLRASIRKGRASGFRR